MNTFDQMPKSVTPVSKSTFGPTCVAECTLNAKKLADASLNPIN